MPEQKFTQEEIHKRQQLRKNLRLLALAAACYYFISAGFSFYEDHEATKIRVVKEIDNVFASPDNFVRILQTALLGERLSQSNTQDGLMLTDTQANAKIYALTEDGEISALNFEADFTQGLNYESMKLLRGFLAACENTTDEKTISKIIEVLKLDQKDPVLLVDGMGAGSKYVRYTLTRKENAISVQAVRNH